MTWMLVPEAAARLGCSDRTIRRRIKAGSLPSCYDGPRLMVDVDLDNRDAAVRQPGPMPQDPPNPTAIVLSTMSTTFVGLRADARAARWAARLAWTVAAAVSVTAGWAWHGATLSNATANVEIQRLRDAASENDRQHVENAQRANMAILASEAERFRLAAEVERLEARLCDAGE